MHHHSSKSLLPSRRLNLARFVGLSLDPSYSPVQMSIWEHLQM